MSGQVKEQYYAIDVLKYIFSIGIVALHTGVLECLGQYQYWFEKGVVRVGVPFFFMVSGFMLERKVSGGGRAEEIFSAWSRRLLYPLVVFEVVNSILYFVYYKSINQSTVKIFLQTIRSILFYPRGALWYIQACLVGIWIICFFIKKKKQKWMIPVGILLYLFAMICNSYYFIVSNSTIGSIINLLLYVICSVRNGLFYGFLFIVLGMRIFKIRQWLDNKNYENCLWVLLTAAYFIFLLELYCLQGKEMKDDGSLFLFLPFFTALLLIITAHFTTVNKKTVILRNLSTGIYLVHSPILMFFKIIMNIWDIGISKQYIFGLVIILAHIICLSAYVRGGRFSKLLK